ncbi:MAG: M20/M25/M40 family metallo-hydrolase [Planctomycetaceae bacterium]
MADRLIRNPYRLRTAVAALLLGVLVTPAMAAKKAAAKSAANAAAIKRIKSDLKYLASDELEGRGVGTKGLDKAAVFVREQFRKAGLDVTRVHGGAYQPFKLNSGSKLGKRNAITFVTKGGKTIELKYDTDFRTCSFARSGEFDGGIVFLGYGIHAPKLKYSDYDGADIKGKVVIIMRRTPQQADRRSAFRGRLNRNKFGALTHKYGEAFSRGAKAVLFVNDTYTTTREARRRSQLVTKSKDAVVKAAEDLEAAEEAKPNNTDKIAAARKKLSQAVSRLQNVRKVLAGNVDELMRFGYGGKTTKGDPRPIFHITQKACNRLLKATVKKSLKDLEAEIDKNFKSKPLTLAGAKARGEASLSPIENDVKNVIGVLEGEGPLADETIVIGAHYDHVGYGRYGSRTPGAVHNGADDNASGTAALIELARRLAAREKKLPRRIVFIAFTAEELGLIGSKKYAEKPVFPLKKTIAMLNMDMVGRLRAGKLTVFCVGSSPVWAPLLKKHAGNPFKLSLRKEIFPRSDHASFARQKVPAIHFFTNTHSDYHRPTDDWQKVNYEGIADVVHMLEKVTLELASTKERPKFTKPPAPPRSKKRRPSRWPYFGSRPDYAKEVEGLYIEGATKGSPADKAGLKKADIIVRFGRFKIGSVEDYANALSSYKAGDTVDITVKRNGKTVVLKATLAKPK